MKTNFSEPILQAVKDFQEGILVEFDKFSREFGMAYLDALRYGFGFLEIGMAKHDRLKVSNSRGLAW